MVHQRVRRQWAPVVAEGNAYCVRCGRLGTLWDLGHVDGNKTGEAAPYGTGRIERRTEYPLRDRAPA